MTKQSFSSLFAVLLFTAAAIPANADTLVGAAGSGSWQSWAMSNTLVNASNQPTYGGPYWNNASGEGSKNNIGWCLVGGGGCSMPNPPGNLPYFGNGTAAVPTMWFATGGTP